MKEMMKIDLGDDHNYVFIDLSSIEKIERNGTYEVMIYLSGNIPPITLNLKEEWGLRNYDRLEAYLLNKCNIYDNTK